MNEVIEKPATLDLEVVEFNLGTLTTNAESVRDLVKTKLAGYSIENYSGERIKEAKTDKAELNAAAKKLNDTRLEYERMFMKPFEPFKAVIDETVKLIKAASAKIDEVVKDVEQGEKDEKRRQIDLYWKDQACDLFRLEQIFDERWLNKTTKLSDVWDAIKDRIAKVKSDLGILDKIGEPEAKAYYLECLDLNRAMAEADRIKANRERLAKLEREKAEAPGPQVIEQEEPEPAYVEPTEEEYAASLPAETASTTTVAEPLALHETIIKFFGTLEQLQSLRAYIDEQGIKYERLA